MSNQAKPIGLLIAAMGGEGGGVLRQWLVDAATAHGFAVQSTSIPGVAQRTGATTYYIEMQPLAEGQNRPVMSLYPLAGNVDIMVASELVEAGLAELIELTPVQPVQESTTGQRAEKLKTVHVA